MNWLLDNKEWLFSGLGVFIITILYSRLFSYVKKKSKKNYKGKINIQQGNNNIVVGNNSSDIRIGSDKLKNSN